MQPVESIFPQKWRILSGSGLKLIAVITMLIDHIGAAIVIYDPTPLFTLGETTYTLYWLMRKIGRLAFPIYCFLLVEGFHHTRDRFAYARNLLIFALISEIPWNLLWGNDWFYEDQNVFFTLFLGLMVMCVIDQYRQDLKREVPLLLLLLLAAFCLNADYGVLGFGLILVLYLLSQRRDWQSLAGCTVMHGSPAAMLAFIPINLYNGKRGFVKGRVAKYAFYAFYPLHMLALYFIREYIIFK